VDSVNQFLVTVGPHPYINLITNDWKKKTEKKKIMESIDQIFNHKPTRQTPLFYHLSTWLLTMCLMCNIFNGVPNVWPTLHNLSNNLLLNSKNHYYPFWWFFIIRRLWHPFLANLCGQNGHKCKMWGFVGW
jgi:hypothetical protein